jgi:hypothetical protein
LKHKYENADVNKLSKKQKVEYENYTKIKDKFEKLKAKNEQQYKLYSNMYRSITFSIDTMKAMLKVEKLTPEDVKNFNTNDPGLLFAKGFLLSMYRNMGDDADLDVYLADLKEAMKVMTHAPL